MDILKQVRPLSQLVHKGGDYLWNPLSLPPFKNSGGAKGYQAHRGTDFEAGRRAVRETKHVIVESVFLVPHAVGSHPIHPAGNQEEVLAAAKI
jgi:hypothetical protein